MNYNSPTMDPTAYDRWWKKRIEKEEQGFARHLVDPTQGEIRLNTIGGAQLCGSKKQRSIDGHTDSLILRQSVKRSFPKHHQRRNPVYSFRPSNHLNRFSATGRALNLGSREDLNMDHTSNRLALSGVVHSPSFPPLQENHNKEEKMGKSPSVRSIKSHKVALKKHQVGKTNLPTKGSCEGPNSVASYPDTPKFSELTDRTSEVLHRLQNLEQELLKEKLKREVAERQINDLMSKKKPQ